MTDILQTLITSADTPAGTYVGARVGPFNGDHRSLMKCISGLSGSKVAPEKLHCTVIYSKHFVDPELLQPSLKTYKEVYAKIIGAAAFDALPGPDGKRDQDVATLVLKLECPEMMAMHEACKAMGCTHTYPELSPHVSLFYGVPSKDCHEAVDKLNIAIAALEEPIYVLIREFFAEPIKQDWAAKNTTKR